MPELPSGPGMHRFKQAKVKKLSATSETAKSFRDLMMNRHNRVSADVAKGNREKKMTERYRRFK